MAYFYGFSRIEIAGRLGISEGATKVRLFRCVERVRGMYRAEQSARC
jgi:DNA-directed RNA polymerase specialized sigma24 family protein